MSPNRINDRPFNRILNNILKGTKAIYDDSWEFHVTYLSQVSEAVQKFIDSPEVNQMLIPITSQGMTSQYKIARDLLSDYDIKVEKEDKKLKINEPELDFDIYRKIGLKIYKYEDVIKAIKEELSGLNK